MNVVQVMSVWVILKKERREYNDAASEGSHDVLYYTNPIQATTCSGALLCIYLDLQFVGLSLIFLAL